MVDEEDNKKITPSIKLNFDGIYKVNFNKRNSEALKNLTNEFNNLPMFKKGNRNNRGVGFKEFEDDFDIDFMINRSKTFPIKNSEKTHEMNVQQSISNKNILAKRFRYEIYGEGREEPQYKEADVFWIKPCDIILIKGSEKACNQIYNKYLGGFVNGGISPIKFSHAFLLWLCYISDKSDGKLSIDLKFEKMDKSRTRGVDTNENDISVKEGQGRMIPIPTLYGLLNDQELSHIGGDFEFREKYKLNAKLATKLNIYVYSEHALRKKTYSEKCALSFPFIIEIIDIFEKWDGKTDDDDKYPSDEFFDSAIEAFRIQMELSIENIEELKVKYGKLRKREGVEDVP